MQAQAIEAEVEQWIEDHIDITDEAGCRECLLILRFL